MSRQVEWAKRAQKKFLRLDQPTQKRIVGDWRVLFSYLDDGTVLIHKIGPRGDIYKR